ncbi:hypothetical protein KIPB_014433, partial [Kipferlia bialata]
VNFVFFWPPPPHPRDRQYRETLLSLPPFSLDLVCTSLVTCLHSATETLTIECVLACLVYLTRHPCGLSAVVASLPTILAILSVTTAASDKTTRTQAEIDRDRDREVGRLGGEEYTLGVRIKAAGVLWNVAASDPHRSALIAAKGVMPSIKAVLK